MASLVDELLPTSALRWAVGSCCTLPLRCWPGTLERAGVAQADSGTRCGYVLPPLPPPPFPPAPPLSPKSPPADHAKGKNAPRPPKGDTGSQEIEKVLNPWLFRQNHEFPWKSKSGERFPYEFTMFTERDFAVFEILIIPLVLLTRIQSSRTDESEMLL